MTIMTSVQHIGVGIDTARYGHRVRFLREDRQPAAKPLTVTEDRAGYDRLQRALEELRQRHPQAQLHVHLDAAGQYAANLERFLRSLPLPLTISIGEPKRNKDYHQAFFPKRTSDDTESHAMARFAVNERPAETPTAPPEFVLLREIAGRLHGQIKDTTRAVNRLHNLLARVFPELASLAPDLGATWTLELLQRYPTPQRIAAARQESLERIVYLKPERAAELQRAARHSVASLTGELAERLVRQMVLQLQQVQGGVKALEELLLDAYQVLPRSGHVQIATIPGIGPATTAILVAKIVDLKRFATPENLVGYFGIFPQEDRSGVDPQGRPHPVGKMRMSAKGCDLVRRYLWNAAKSAMLHNPAVRELYRRLRAKGTRGDVALGHCMRKLLHQVFGVWSSDRPFDRQYETADAAPLAEAGVGQSANQAPALEPTRETAAGHSREQCPDRKVVTAAASHVEPVSVARAKREAIDYAFLREQIGLERVLAHIGVLPSLLGRTQRRGPCPLCRSGGRRSFSVNLSKNVYQCFQPGCGSGNVLDFWAAYQQLPLPVAARHLADTFGLSTQRTPRTTTNPPSQRGVITSDAP